MQIIGLSDVAVGILVRRRVLFAFYEKIIKISYSDWIRTIYEKFV
jgi:hypothetical protein